jgi:subtilisin family serine protease
MFIRAKRGVTASIVALTCMVTACEGEVVPNLQSSQPSDSSNGKRGFHINPLPGTIGAIAPTADRGAVEVSENGRYIVHFKEETVSARFGALRKLQKAGQGSDVGTRLKMANPDISAYKQELADLQREHVADMTRVLGRNPVTHTFTTAINAAVIVGEHSEAIRVAKLNHVAFVEPDHVNQIITDRGPTFIGAPTIWDGSASGLASKGENMVVGIIDTGIAFNLTIEGKVGVHPSFLATAEDGYTHVNPLGTGTFLGGCVEHPEWCNDKLIGIYSFLEAQGGVDASAPDADPIWSFKDIDGHGSHVAGTVAGNPLSNVPLIDADGNLSKGFSFERISGVAPRANIISYKVCAGGCVTSDVVAAVEQAIENGVVDVLNHSIGSEGGSPWAAAKSLAFLSAREAGIFVASAAGNDGPTPATATRVGNAPWNAGVAATTHDRAFLPKGLMNLSGGDTPAPTGITGYGLTGAFTGPIVYAKNYPFGAAGQPGFDSPQTCQVPFPAGTFTADQIVLCDRGVTGRTAKGQAVRDGGAGGFILANVTGEATSVDPDAHVIPSIHINAAHGDLLRAWLATGTGHTGTIEASLPASTNAAVADIMAGFSSRGPYTGFDFLGPNVAAPGANIFAPGALHPGAGSVPGLYGIISGTSMASPHIAGSAALLKATRPDWTDAEVLSAMITTGVTTLRKEDGTTAVDVHDIGGGRIQLAAAVKAGLLLDETMDGFLAGDPAKGGDPGELNVAELVRQKCVVECGWTRTVKATTAGSWTVTGPSFVTISPAQFTLEAGESQDVTITADVDTLALGTYVFGEVTFTPASAELPVQHIPLVVLPTGSSLPTDKEIIATRGQGSTTIAGIKSVEAESLTFKVAGLGLAQKQELSVAQDSDPSAVYDDITDGVSFTTLTVADGTEQLVVEITASQSPDLDLRVGIDVNGDGLPSEDEEVCVSATSTSLERCPIDLAGATGLPPFWIVVQNFQASAPDAIDPFTLATTIVTTEDAGNLVVKGPTGPVSAMTPWNMVLNWTSPTTVGESAYGKVRVYRSATQDETTLIGTLQIRLLRAPNDVAIALPTLVKIGTAFPVQLTVGPNYDSVTRRYQIRVPLPTGVSYVNGSGGRLVRGAVVLNVSTPAGTTTPTPVQFQVTPQRASAGQALSFTATDTVNNPNSVAQTATATTQVSGYVFSGFLSPRPNSTIFAGIPTTIRFEIRDGATNTLNTTMPVALQITNPDGTVAVDATVAGSARGHSYAWRTNSLKSGVYGVKATLEDGTSYTMSVRIFSFRG